MEKECYDGACLNSLSHITNTARDKKKKEYLYQRINEPLKNQDKEEEKYLEVMSTTSDFSPDVHLIASNMQIESFLKCILDRCHLSQKYMPSKGLGLTSRRDLRFAIVLGRLICL